MSRKKNSAALVTGASSGIGWELAKLAAADYSDLILVARREERLQKLAVEVGKISQAQVHILPQDLAAPEAARRLHSAVEKLGVAVDLLVNNAGYANYGFFHETDYDFDSDMIRVNVLALTQLTKLFLPAMVERGHGYILNLASTASFQPGPLMAVYYASKAYVLSFSEALENEVKDKGVQVTALCPGPVWTEFQEVAKLEKSNMLKVLHFSKVEDVAQAGYEGMKKGKTLVVPGILNKLTAQSHRIGPRSWVTKVVRQIQKEN